jgi:hypothetical protein
VRGGDRRRDLGCGRLSRVLYPGRERIPGRLDPGGDRLPGRIHRRRRGRDGGGHLGRHRSLGGVDPGAELLRREAAGLAGGDADVGESLLELGADDLTARLLAEHELHLRVDRLGDHPARSRRRAHPESAPSGGRPPG